MVSSFSVWEREREREKNTHALIHANTHTQLKVPDGVTPCNADGHCFFRAVSYALYGTPTKYEHKSQGQVWVRGKCRGRVPKSMEYANISKPGQTPKPTLTPTVTRKCGINARPSCRSNNFAKNLHTLLSRAHLTRAWKACQAQRGAAS